MNRDSSRGSYVQLNVFDEKEKAFVESKSALPPVWPYKKCLCTRRDTILVAIVLIGASILIVTTLSLGLPEIKRKQQKFFDPDLPISSSPLRSFQKAVIVSDAKPCSVIGRNILEAGGGAVDAAVAALFCAGVVNPQSMGLGGGFLMTIYLRESETSSVIDAREVAPENATMDMFEGNKILSEQGGLSIAVPGELRGYYFAWQKYGNLDWKTLIMPAVKLCQEGFPVSRHLANHLRLLESKILGDDSLKSEFFNADTKDLYKEGEIMKRPLLGKTLLEIHDKGADVLYTGDLHKQFLNDIRNCGGIITANDLSNYKPLLKKPIEFQLDYPEKLSILSAPLPGSGPILNVILNTLSFYNMTSEDFQTASKAALSYHRIAEAFKFGFAFRTQLGDDAFVDLKDVLFNLTSKDFAKLVHDQISDDSTFPTEYYDPTVPETKVDHGTAHISVLAENGDAVSVTSTINTYLGSLCRSPSTGIILNNAMDDFSSPNITNYFGVPPHPSNQIVPGKRPLSSMSPTIITSPDTGDVKMVAGAAGGTHIITALVQNIIRALWLEENVKQATDAPRIHHQLFPNYLEYEKGFPQIYIDKLKKFGHALRAQTAESNVMSILRYDGRLTSNVDFRKGGGTDGY